MRYLSLINLVCGDFLSHFNLSITLLSQPTLPVSEEVYDPIPDSVIVEPCRRKHCLRVHIRQRHRDL